MSSTVEKKGILLSKTATTGWLNWVHGELWLFDDGILRVPLGLIKSALLVGYRYGLRRSLHEQVFSLQEFTEITHNPKNLWIPYTAIGTAKLKHGPGGDELRITTIQGNAHQLLWIPRQDVYDLLGEALSRRISDKLRVQGQL
jgi:hypothetical protein